MGAFTQPVARFMNSSSLPGETPSTTCRRLSVSYNERLCVVSSQLPGLVPRLVTGVCFARENGNLVKMVPRNKAKRNGLCNPCSGASLVLVGVESLVEEQSGDRKLFFTSLLNVSRAWSSAIFSICLASETDIVCET